MIDNYKVYFFISICLVVSSLFCVSPKDKPDRGGVYFFPDTLDIGSKYLPGLDNSTVRYSTDLDCLGYVFRNYRVLQFLQSGNTYIIDNRLASNQIIETTILREVRVSENVFNALLSSIYMNGDITSESDVIKIFTDLFYFTFEYAMLDLNNACEDHLFKIDALLNDTTTVHRKGDIIINCEEYQDSILEIHNSLKKRASKIYLPMHSLSNLKGDSRNVVYLIHSNKQIKLVHLNFNGTCYGTYFLSEPNEMQL